MNGENVLILVSKKKVSRQQQIRTFICGQFIMHIHILWNRLTALGLKRRDARLRRQPCRMNANYHLSNTLTLCMYITFTHFKNVSFILLNYFCNVSSGHIQMISHCFWIRINFHVLSMESGCVGFLQICMEYVYKL